VEAESVNTEKKEGAPVLILAYNRVNELTQVLDAVIEQAPISIYVSVDGPKPKSAQDEARVSAVRKALRGFQESYPIRTRFAETNGGVLNGVLDGIDWFFSQESRGIILEDDVLVAPDSLELASSLLEQLQSNHRIGSISLFNPVPRSRLTHPDDTVRLSTLPSSQFWGTWSDRWNVTQRFRHDPPAAQTDVMRAVGAAPNARLRRFWLNHLANTSEGWLCWEDLWILTHWVSRWSAAYTNGNFSRHLGFNLGATNSWDQPSWYPTHYDDASTFSTLDLNPEPDLIADAWYFNQRFGLSPWKKIKHSVWSRAPWLRASYLSTRRMLADKL
jgi:hypothetical protein